MSNIGHGAPGLRSNLRDLDTLIDESVSQKEVLVELRPVQEVTDWALDSGSSYVSAVSTTIDGIRADIVDVKTTVDPALTRRETIQDVRDNAGSFYYDPDLVFTQTAVWDDANLWDGGLLWDQVHQIYIHQSDGSDPGNASVAVVYGFYYASKEQSHPTLGPDLLTDGGLENWTTSTNLTDWTETLAGDGAVTQETSILKVGSNSAKLTNGGTGGTNTAEITDTATLNSGGFYRFSGYYQTQTADTSVTTLLVSKDAGATNVLIDGRETGASPDTDLDNTSGSWRRFVFDFRCPTTATWTLGVRVEGSGATGTTYLDDLKVQRIHRFVTYQPRVASSSVPAIKTGSNDIFFGGKKIGVGIVSLINSDGSLEKLIPQFEWINQKVIVDYGGRFPYEDQEVLRDNMGRAFTGQIQKLVAGDNQVQFSLQDVRAFFHIKLPKRVYDDQTFLNLDTRRFQGAPRPIFFGAKDNITPVRIDLIGAGNYGKYEICDTEDSPDGIKALTAIYAYDTEDDANNKRTDRRHTLTSGTDYTEDLANGQFTIDVDVGPLEIIRGHKKLNFDEGSTELTARLTKGFYTAPALATEVQTQMRAVGSSDLNCTYSDTTHKFTISKDAGTLNLLTETGTNEGTSAWETLGFNRDTDRTLALSYEANDAVFEDVDFDHFIRVDAQGYKDDASGTFTGTADALIEKGVDILRTLFVKFMDKSAADIDETSFSDARTRAPETLALYLKQSVSTREIFTKLEYSNIGNIVIDGAGKIYYKIYVGAIPDDIIHIFDRDIIDFSVERSASDIYETIRVEYDQDASTDIFKTREATDTSIGVRLGRPDVREFQTYIKIAGNATNTAQRMLELARKSARKVMMTVRGSKALKLEVGDKHKLTRKRGLGLGGQIRDTVFRVLSLSKSPLTGETRVEVIDDITSVGSAACVATCQSFCQNACQDVCEQSCQETCELACQTGCENTCQEACQTDCQTACQLGCQATCELVCQSVCKSECQGACQTGGCQTACELNCQTTCETSCQTGCQLGCQDPCQADPCQDACQTCQNACELGECQDTCKLVCQSGCQVTCERACQIFCQTTDEEK